MDRIPQRYTKIFKENPHTPFMPYDNRKPLQLRNKVEETQDKLYARQSQLMERLKPLMRKAEIIEENTEPFLYSPDNPLSEYLSEEPKMNGNGRLKLIKKLNEFQPNKNPKKNVQPLRIKKISQIRPDILFGLK